MDDNEFYSKHPVMTQEKSARTKNWACGSRTPSEHDEFVIIDKKVHYKSVKYAPAWWKIIDEVIVNAADQHIKCLNNKLKVDKIKIDFSIDGRVKVYNNGPGIWVRKHEVAAKHFGLDELWFPTFLFGYLHQGGNHVPAKDSITGGTNGMGAKLSILYSTDAILETVDIHNMYFQQRWRQNMEIAEKPLVINLLQQHNVPKDRTIPHTTLSFMPDYSGSFSTEFTKETYAELEPLLRMRAYFLAAYVGTNCKVWFNNELITTNNIDAIAKLMFPEKKILSTTINSDDPIYRYDWQLCAVLVNSSKFAMRQLGNVNGIMVRGGKHINHINNELVAGVKDKIMKLFKDKDLKFSAPRITENVFLVLNCKIPLPEWTGQRKDILDTPIANFKTYKINPKFLNEFGDCISANIINKIFAKQAKTTTRSAALNIDYDHYTDCKFAGTASAAQCSLLFTEGKAAKSQTENGISKCLDPQYYGVIATGGVPINAVKKYTAINTDDGDYIKFSKQLEKNAFITAFLAMTGLNPNVKYETEKEVKSLRYGAVIACVDQDLDGKGKILPLILAMFEKFWPKLIDRGYFKWFMTPIIRAYPKRGRKIVSFYREYEYEDWIKINNVNNYIIKYYKGLGTHSREESENMFKSFNQRVYTFYLDERSNMLFETYYGKSANLRKDVLSKPPIKLTRETIELQEKTKLISTSDHLLVESHEFQLDDIERKLDHIIDGQNQAGRKILDAIIKAFRTRDHTKVDKLAGFVAENENYQHGQVSLEKSIQGRALITPGGVQLPLLLPGSFLGTRKEGGNDAAPPRYTDVSLNKKLVDLLFPKDDYRLLQFKFDEGKRGEPKYFVPILPLVILESSCVPAHAWKMEKWARDVFKVIECIRKQIFVRDDLNFLNLPPATYSGSSYAWNGTFRHINGKMHSMGIYKIIDDKIIITELPLRIWTYPYVKNLEKKKKSRPELIKRIEHGSCTDDTVHIVVYLHDGALDIIENMGDAAIDGVERYFDLYCDMTDHLNFVDIDDSIKSFENYSDILKVWFPVRRKLYSDRVADKQILLQMRIKVRENMLRYIRDDTLKLATKSKKVMIEALETAKYDKFRITLVKNPEFIPTDCLINEIMLHPEASFNYLLNISDIKKSSEAIEKHEEKLSNLRRELNDLDKLCAQGRFPGAKLFERELDEIEKVLREGFNTRWKFDDVGRYEF